MVVYNSISIIYFFSSEVGADSPGVVPIALYSRSPQKILLPPLDELTSPLRLKKRAPRPFRTFGMSCGTVLEHFSCVVHVNGISSTATLRSGSRLQREFLWWDNESINSTSTVHKKRVSLESRHPTHSARPSQPGE